MPFSQVPFPVAISLKTLKITALQWEHILVHLLVCHLMSIVRYCTDLQWKVKKFHAVQTWNLWFPNPKIQVRKSKFSEKSFDNAIKYSILSTKLKISRLYSFRTLSLILLSLFRLRNTKDESVSRWTCLLSLYCCQNGHFCLGVRVGESWNRAPEYCWLGDSDRKYERREGMIVRGLFF